MRRGIYIHVPFCASKCPYCDFYSLRTRDPSAMEQYVSAVIAAFPAFPAKADTLYLGGGTPSLLPPDSLIRLIEAAKQSYDLPSNAEITVECNPSSDLEHLIPAAASCGVNRISFGMQSAVSGERRQLGRFSDRERVEEVLRLARANGIDNLSLDIMLGVPGQTMDSLEETLQFCADSGVPHISAYLLKIEPGTVFARRQEKLALPDEDTVCAMYLHTCQFLEAAGLRQYEISNFARPGFESRHNLHYWRCEEYVGIGPAAHSFYHGRRFYYPRNLDAFLRGDRPIEDGAGGDLEERIMLALRLREGWSGPVPESVRQYVQQPGMARFLNWDGETLSLTSEGFLVSNYLIAELLERFETK